MASMEFPQIRDAPPDSFWSVEMLLTADFKKGDKTKLIGVRGCEKTHIAAKTTRNGVSVRILGPRDEVLKVLDQFRQKYTFHDAKIKQEDQNEVLVVDGADPKGIREILPHDDGVDGKDDWSGGGGGSTVSRKGDGGLLSSLRNMPGEALSEFAEKALSQISRTSEGVQESIQTGSNIVKDQVVNRSVDSSASDFALCLMEAKQIVLHYANKETVRIPVKTTLAIGEQVACPDNGYMYLDPELVEPAPKSATTAKLFGKHVDENGVKVLHIWATWYRPRVQVLPELLPPERLAKIEVMTLQDFGTEARLRPECIQVLQAENVRASMLVHIALEGRENLRASLKDINGLSSGDIFAILEYFYPPRRPNAGGGGGL